MKLSPAQKRFVLSMAASGETLPAPLYMYSRTPFVIAHSLVKKGVLIEARATMEIEGPLVYTLAHDWRKYFTDDELVMHELAR